MSGVSLALPELRLEVFLNINLTLQNDAFCDFSNFSVEYLVDLRSILHVSMFQVDFNDPLSLNILLALQILLIIFFLFGREIMMLGRFIPAHCRWMS